MDNSIRPPTELLKGINEYLSKNRNSLTIEEISLINDVSKYLELSRNQKKKVPDYLIEIAEKLLKLFVDSNILSNLMDIK